MRRPDDASLRYAAFRARPIVQLSRLANRSGGVAERVLEMNDDPQPFANFITLMKRLYDSYMYLYAITTFRFDQARRAGL